MSTTAAITFKLTITAECLVTLAGNIFTIFVFWKNRKKLKRTSFLVINLTIAGLLLGFTTPIAIDVFNLSSRQLKEPNTNKTAQSETIFTAFQRTFTAASVLFLVLISLERTYALIWPFRHRVASTKGYTYSVVFVWFSGISVGGVSQLAVYNILSFVHWIVALCAIVVLALIIVCVSYLAIRKKLNRRVPDIGAAQCNQNVKNQNKKLSRTLFVVIAASLVFWLPSTVIICIYFLCFRCVPVFLLYISTMLQVANSLVNPIIYSFRIPMFKETLKRMKLRKKSKRYKVHYRY